jgi:hypothetical protein
MLVTDTGWYWLTVQFGNNCSITDSIKVLYAQCSCSMYIPNAFTPNNDGMNEGFRTYNLCEMSYYEFAFTTELASKYSAQKNHQSPGMESIKAKGSGRHVCLHRKIYTTY